jgi:hypothetical protein
MVRTALVALVALLAAQPSASAAEPAGATSGPFGMGLMVGSPTGITVKIYLAKGHAIDAGVGGALLVPGLQVHADYLVHPVMLRTDASFFLPLYAGGGVRVLQHLRSAGRSDDVHVGARGVVGLLFDLREVPLDIFLETALIVDLFLDGHDSPDHHWIDLDVSAGVRYYF